ncbi:hypothetical protein LOC54_10615 [Acetobacter sp. AN02]|uniref:hypothetical protein n=1 Tax=Acetobacter sp. AN02 TaxID=2894186 RepID=UPI0024343A0E|nr:hypothetical protein [Acetobacter sp. AN02]MDG6095544.1 hypothetical protein [Acetobacter sp. AN02]
MSWGFWKRFGDEAWALVSRQHWTGISNASPNGEALDALVAQMRASAEQEEGFA